VFQTPHVLLFCAAIKNIGTCGLTMNTILVNMYFFLRNQKTKQGASGTVAIEHIPVCQ